MDTYTLDQQGDPKNQTIVYRDFAELYCQNINWLAPFIRKNVHNPSDAEDITQDVFERLIKKMSQQQTPQQITFSGNIRAFITTIAKGIIIDSWRRKELERQYLQYLTDLQEDDIVQDFDFTEIVDAIFILDQMLRALDDKVRYAFLLSHLYDKTYAEIAVQMDISERTVKAYMAKAMLHCMKMRSRLELDQ
ncbi:MAG: sigma-70 family RNA polymerase sigma factor [Acinetobacter populi]|uniref:RNA polymerase sigma factor n=1 Tax=Acinetobacter populi TaxID=1582270 RepID=UPI002355B730|nr:sigma-70 family RNA polymerase sigma factor [Acinetobacter populi]MCH4247061.1 sigma-70 family RNA polymerase sigma factor [Acinetobacter populi]